RACQFLLVLPGIVAYILGLYRVRPPLADRLSAKLGLYLRAGESDRIGLPRRERWGWMWPSGVALAIAVLLLIPHPSRAAGLSFTKELLFPFLHWNAYVMGAAIGFREGRALGVDVYTEYGVGYPLLVNWLSPLVPLSYSNLILMATIYGCIYFMALA